MGKRALISVYDKAGISGFAKELVNLGWEIISTGGTLSHLRNEGIEAIDVTDITNFPEMLDGRVKTLSPYVFAGLLYKRSNQEHVKTVEEYKINSIDMVVNTLYPFVETLKNPNSTQEEIIEKIDIGGPSMIRACAKNYADCIIVTSQDSYDEVISKLKNGEFDLDLRRDYARKAFEVTAAYDIAIATYFQSFNEERFPEKLFLDLTKEDQLRYGENPHQDAVYYRDENVEGTLNDATIIQGKKLSFNNLNDASMAIDSIKEFQDRPTAIGLKHANACAIASADDIYDAYIKCYEADSISIFGGIVVLNREVDEKLAKKLTEIFLEIIVAPSFTPEAVEAFKVKKNLRVLELPSLMKLNPEELDMKKVLGGMLVQDKDIGVYNELKTVTNREATEAEMNDLLFAYKCTKAIKSNGIVIAKNEVTTGIGLGEVNRIWAVNEAIERSGEEVVGSVCASDAFFPFGDCMEALAKAGVTAVIQPGGSIRDEESVVVANDNDIAMVFTNMRHFKH